MFIETARKGKISKFANFKVYSQESEGIASQSSVIVQEKVVGKKDIVFHRIACQMLTI